MDNKSGWAMRRATIDQISFNLRAAGLRTLRRWRDLRQGPPRLRQIAEPDLLAADWQRVVGSSTTKLWTIGQVAEWPLTAGKVQNLRQAIRRLHGLRIPAGSTFSFWRHVDRPIAWNGYVPGREIREGCLVASIGGGLCQLSNALYAAAVAAGCEIVERHRHSRVIPGSLAEIDLDATIFWNYVDLRFRPKIDLVIDARLTATELILHLRGLEVIAEDTTGPDMVSPTGRISAMKLSNAPGDCLTCGETSCVYIIRQNKDAGRTAWLLDEYWPEFDLWQQKQRAPRDHLHLPLDGQRWHRPNYAWTLPERGQWTSHSLLTLIQARRLRTTSVQGAARQQALIERDRQLAEAYHRRLPADADRLVVSLNLLPHLWRLGALGGRRVSVFMTRSPLRALQQALDQAAAKHPASPTLRDFRAPAWLVSAEVAALAAAETLITPHSQVAEMLNVTHSGQVEHIAWSLPAPPASDMPMPEQSADDRPRVLFAASGLARKGAYEMREASHHASFSLRVLGRAQDTAAFWRGLDVDWVMPGTDPLAGIDVVALPAFVEQQPRLLLRAITRGIPVVCSPACGLAGLAGVTFVEAGNAGALAATIKASVGHTLDRKWSKSAE